ncbi:MAG: hypothetical protein JSR77_04910 [Planctomycetes bacterium]|nr:hypothetical protein [Planctomycetota bacterium]
MKRVINSILAASCGIGFLCGAASAQNVLHNPGFEDICTPAADWQTYGNVQVGTFFNVSGSRSLKMFGPFCCPLGYSGFYQDVPTVPGDQWDASTFVTNPTWDALSWNESTQAGTRVFIELQFLDSGHNIIHPYGQYKSPVLDHNTDGIPIPLAIPTSTTPPGAAFVRFAVTAEQGNWVGGAAWFDDVSLSHPGGANLLLNPSFENQPAGCIGSSFAYWGNWGNGQANRDESPRNGAYAAKLFGGYYAPVASSGWYQDVAATPGSQWQASGWATTRGNDTIADGNDVFMSFEFRDANDLNISEWEPNFAPYRSSAVPTGAANDLTYHFYQTGIATAPEGTAKVRCLIYQLQNNYAGGSTWWDDIELIQIGGVPCVADYNQDGGVDGGDVQAFFVDWEQGLTAADANGDGGIDGGDVETFFMQWEAGSC